MYGKSVEILSTRPLGESLIKKAAENEINIEVISFISTEPVTNKILFTKLSALEGKKTVAVLTSAIAVSVLAGKMKEITGWKFYCLSGATQAALKQYYPKAEIAGTAMNALELAKVMVQHKVKKAHFFCGDQRRAELPDYLHHYGVHLSEYIIYETVHTPLKVDKIYDGVLFFSPSAVDSYLKENESNKKTVFFAIGQTTENSIEEHDIPNKIVVSNEPSANAVVDKVISYFRKDIY
jgi:uroporphyrinogen-III synthase